MLDFGLPALGLASCPEHGEEVVHRQASAPADQREASAHLFRAGCRGGRRPGAPLLMLHDPAPLPEEQFECQGLHGSLQTTICALLVHVLAVVLLRPEAQFSCGEIEQVLDILISTATPLFPRQTAAARFLPARWREARKCSQVTARHLRSHSHLVAARASLRQETERLYSAPPACAGVMK